MPAQPAFASHLTFASADALFQAAQAMRFRDPETCDGPVIRNGGVYVVKGRPVRLDIDYGDVGRIPRACLVRLDWSSLTRCRKWLATVLSVFGADVGARTHASSRCAKRLVKLQASMAPQHPPQLAARRALLAGIGTFRMLGMATGPLDNALCANLASQFERPVRDAAYSICNLHTVAALDAAAFDRIVLDLLLSVRTPLDGQIRACQLAGFKIDAVPVVRLILQEEQFRNALRELYAVPKGGDSEGRSVADWVLKEMTTVLCPDAR